MAYIAWKKHVDAAKFGQVLLPIKEGACGHFSALRSSVIKDRIISTTCVPFVTYYLLTKREVFKVKSQTEVLPY